MRIDLHTHSYGSPDGSLKPYDYHHMLQSGKLDYIAITDHNSIRVATDLHEELGEQLIIGEEISTKAGDIIGLFLQHVVPKGISLQHAVEAIHEQGGLAYIPHPFEKVRSSVSAEDLAPIVNEIDVIEVYNGRSMQSRSLLARQWASRRGIAAAASSDAHGLMGWGNTCSRINEAPTKHNLVRLLKQATFDTRSTGLIGRLYPSLNRFRKSR